MAKLALCEFDAGHDWTRYDTGTWVNYGPGIFYTDFTGTYSSLTSAWVEGAETIEYVGSVATVYATKDGTQYDLTSVSSTSNMHSEASFYWDETNDLLYIRLPSYEPPDIYEINVGITQYLAQRHWNDNVNSRQYLGDVLSMPNIKKRVDRFFWGKIFLQKASVVLQNAHGEYDLFYDWDVFGQTLKIYFGDTTDAYADMSQVWTGRIDDFTISESDITINAIDPRNELDEPIPPNVFTTATYANLYDNDENKPIPLAYGTLYNRTPKCVNRASYVKESGGDLTFKLCDMTNHDAIGSIDTVYYNGESLSGTAGADDYHWDTAQDSLTDATFVINVNGDVDFDFDKVTVDFTGYEDSGGSLISKGLDVIKDLISTYVGTSYTAANYDTTQWASLASDDRAVGLYVEKESTVLEAIEQITQSTQIQFDTTGAGLYTARLYDKGKVPDRTIQEDELMGDLELDYSSEQFLSRAVVEYAGGKTYVYDDEETEVARDAIAFAERVMDFSAEILPYVEIQTKTQNIDVEIEDIIYIKLDRRNKDWLGRVSCRVESIDIDLNDYMVTLGLRVLGDFVTLNPSEMSHTQSLDAVSLS